MGYTTDFEGNFVLASEEQNLDESFEEFVKKAKHTNGLSYCQWILTYSHKQGNIHYYKLMWDGGEKFYDYVEWLTYLINTYFKNSTLSGLVYFTGEVVKDSGVIKILDNTVKVYFTEDLVAQAKL